MNRTFPAELRNGLHHFFVAAPPDTRIAEAIAEDGSIFLREVLALYVKRSNGLRRSHAARLIRELEAWEAEVDDDNG